MTIWDEILARVRDGMPAEDFRRWFSETAYASDSGDQITVWVPTESIRRQMTLRYQDSIDVALTALGRPGTHVRFVVTGIGDDDDDE